MADELKNQLDEQKQLIADLRKANEDLIDQIADANVEKFTGEIEDLKKQLVDANEKTLSFSTEIEGFNVKSTELQDKIDELTKENETAKAEIAKIEAEKLQNRAMKTVVISDCVASMYGEDLHVLGLENIARCLGWVLTVEEFKNKVLSSQKKAAAG